MARNDKSSNSGGQRLALIIAGVGILWVLANFAGAQLGLSNRTRALFDLVALAGFGWAIYEAIKLWRERQ